MRSAEMRNATEKQLMRLLHGELPPSDSRRLELQLERDGELSTAYQRLAETWDSVELPPPGAVHAGFAAGVVAAARQLREGELSWSLAPGWARAGATLALTAGLLLGAAFDRGVAAPVATPGGEQSAVVEADDDADAVPLSLAEVYWLSLEESGGQLAAATTAERGAP